jgi:hypothetical protein
MAHRQAWSTFTPFLQEMQDDLKAIFFQANYLAVMVQRDVLTVRLFVDIPLGLDTEYGLYDPDSVDNAWASMKAVKGDPMIGLYHLGLWKETEEGSWRIKKSSVTTAALLRTIHGQNST